MTLVFVFGDRFLCKIKSKR